MTPRYFYSTERAARALHLTPRHFIVIALAHMELPMVFHGDFAVRCLWSGPTVFRLLLLYRPHPKWVNRKKENLIDDGCDFAYRGSAGRVAPAA